MTTTLNNITVIYGNIYYMIFKTVCPYEYL